MEDKDHSNSNNMSGKKGKQLNAYARFSAIGFQMIAIIAIMTFIGVKLDDAYPNKYHLFTIFLSLLGVAMSMYYVIKQANKTSDKDD